MSLERLNMPWDEITPLLNTQKKKYILGGAVLSVCLVVTITCAAVLSKDTSDDDNGYCEVIITNRLSPLLIEPGTTTLMYPAPGSNAIRFSSEQSVEFACPGKQVKAFGEELGNSIVSAVCRKDGSFLIENFAGFVKWESISCSSISGPIIRKWKNEDLNDDFKENCFKEGTTMGSIGFYLNQTRYLSAIDICFNTKTSLALYSRYDLHASVHDRVPNVGTSSFQIDKIFYPNGINVKDLYLTKNIRILINQILELDSNDTTYINDKMFINKGHLAPKADFYYAPMQLATYRYINVVPQWESFNGGNWNDIEISVRNYAFDNKVDLKIWTGSYGIASLPNKKKLSTNIYLYATKKVKLFPVPEIFWKLVYDPKKQKAVVLIGHNNPYEDITKPVYCNKDVKLSWIKWDANNVQKGYSYACDYNDVKLKQTITYLPDIPVKELL